MVSKGWVSLVSLVSSYQWTVSSRIGRRWLLKDKGMCEYLTKYRGHMTSAKTGPASSPP